MARRDHQILNEWKETRASVLSRRLDAASASSSSGPSTSRRNRSQYAPELALRYEVDGASVLSTGYDSGSALRRGGLAERENPWTLGAGMAVAGDQRYCPSATNRLRPSNSKRSW